METFASTWPALVTKPAGRMDAPLLAAGRFFFPFFPEGGMWDTTKREVPRSASMVPSEGMRSRTGAEEDEEDEEDEEEGEEEEEEVEEKEKAEEVVEVVCVEEGDAEEADAPRRDMRRFFSLAGLSAKGEAGPWRLVGVFAWPPFSLSVAALDKA